MSKTQLQTKEKLSAINFDHWSEIAKTDPETFEAMRIEVINAFIDSAPLSSQPRLRGLQWQIDCLRARSSNPLSACIKISQMMWETLQQLGDVTQGLANPAQCNPDSKPCEATILSFSPAPTATK